MVLGLIAMDSAQAAAVPPHAGPGQSSATSTSSRRPLDDRLLSAFNGGQAIVAISNQNLTAVNSGNSVNANNVTNGPVSVDANAFSGFAGMGNFVINTGNNNNLQGSMSVNIIMTPK